MRCIYTQHRGGGMNCLGNPPNSTRKEHRMLDILFLSRSSLLYAVLLLSAITILSLALPCFAYEATQKFRRRRGLF